MATLSPNFGTTVSDLTLTALDGLANNAYWESANINNSSGLWAEFFLTITTTAVGAANSFGYIELFIASSIDGGVDYSGQADAAPGIYSNAGNQDSRHLRSVGVRSCNAVETDIRTYNYHFVFGDLPQDFTVVLNNVSGQTLGVGNDIEYRLNNYVSG